MKVLVGCETSGMVRDAFIALGHEAMSCDILPSDVPGPHYMGDVLDLLDQPWDLAIFHPPCTFLTSAGLHWNGRREGRAAETEKALEFVRKLLGANIPKIALENPIGRISTAIRKPDQIFQPYQFGADASKATCLWLKGLAPLVPTKYIKPRITADGQQRWANQTDSGQNKLGPSEDRWKLRSETYPGVAAAMALQWGTNFVPPTVDLNFLFSK